MTLADSKREALLSAPVGPTLLRLAWPMLMGIASIMLFNIVDTFWVGQLGTQQLAAVSFTFAPTFMVMSIVMGLGVGTTSVIARAIGTGDRTRVRRLTTHSLALAVLVVVAVASLGVLTLEPVFAGAMNAPPELLPLIESYMTPWYLGCAFLVIPMVGNSAIRATGDTRTPSLVMMLAGLVNLVLDPLLIFGVGPFPRLELAGAAIATVISWTVTFAAALWVLGRREHLLELRWPGLAALLSSWREVLHVGLPAAATNLAMPLATGVLVRLIADHGTQAVAAFGVGTRLESLGLIGVIALSTAITPFTGQNYGAGQCGRVREALRFGLKASLIWGLGVASLFALSGGLLARLFDDNPAVIDIARRYLWVVPISYGAFGAATLVSSIFNAVNRPLRSAAIIALRLFVFAIPLAWIGDSLFGLTGIFAGVCVANFAAGSLAFFLVRRFLDLVEAEQAVPASGALQAPSP